MPRSQNNQNIKQKQYYDKFNKDFKNGPHQENLKKKNSLSPVFHTNSLSLIKMNVYRWNISSNSPQNAVIPEKNIALLSFTWQHILHHNHKETEWNTKLPLENNDAFMKE